MGSLHAACKDGVAKAFEMSVTERDTGVLEPKSGDGFTERPPKCDSRGNMQTDTCEVRSTPESPAIKLERPSPQPAVEVHMGMRFTNFFIDEILKPHFGKGESYQHSPFTSTLKSECSLLTQKFSGIIHRPIPTFTQTQKTNSEQSVALDLRRDRQIKLKDKTKVECVELAKRSPSLCVRSEKTGSPVDILHPSVGETAPRSPSPTSSVSSSSTSPESSLVPSQGGQMGENGKPNLLWPAWVYCTRYSDRPSSGEYAGCLSVTVNMNVMGGGSVFSTLKFAGRKTERRKYVLTVERGRYYHTSKN